MRCENMSACVCASGIGYCTVICQVCNDVAPCPRAGAALVAIACWLEWEWTGVGGSEAGRMWISAPVAARRRLPGSCCSGCMTLHQCVSRARHSCSLLCIPAAADHLRVPIHCWRTQAVQRIPTLLSIRCAACDTVRWEHWCSRHVLECCSGLVTPGMLRWAACMLPHPPQSAVACLHVRSCHQVLPGRVPPR
jgi:hypothetical protein